MDKQGSFVIGKLDYSELTKSIDKMVSDVGEKSNKMAELFQTAMNKMTGAMKDFAITQKVSVDLMKESWREMSSAFDAMVRAQNKIGTPQGGQTGTGAGQRAKDSREATQAELEEAQALKELFNEVDRMRKTNLSQALKMPADNLEQAWAKLNTINAELDKMNAKEVLSPAQLQRTQAAIDALKEKITQLAATQDATMRGAANRPVTFQDSAMNALRELARQRAELFREIKESQRQMDAAVQPKIDALYQKASATSSKIYELKKELDNLQASGKTDHGTEMRIQVLTANIERLEAEWLNYHRQISNAPQYFRREDFERIEQMRVRMRQLTQQSAELQKSMMTSVTAKPGATAHVDESLTALQRQAQAIRESTEWQEKGVAYIRSAVNEQATYIVSARQKLTLEEQLLDVQRQEIELAKRLNKERGVTDIDQQYQRAISVPVDWNNIASVQDALRGVEELLLKVQGTDLLSPENVRYAQTMIEAYKQRVGELAAMTSGGGLVVNRPRGGTNSINEYTNLQEAMAKVLSTQSHLIVEVDKHRSSQEKLQKALSQTESAYKKLTASQRNSDFGKELLDRMFMIRTSLTQMNREMNRPRTLAQAMSMEERTLDQVSAKIQQLRAYMNGLDMTNANSRKEIESVQHALNGLQKKQQEILGTNQQLFQSNTALARSWNYMKNRLAFYFTVGASTQFVKNLIDVRSQYEMTERALGILVDSAERGTQIFSELSSMALVSPYTLLELSSAAKQLTAYDIAAKDVVGTTKRLADMAAAVGIPLERLTYSLGHIKSYGYLNSRDARMFANAGIPLVKQLAEYYSELEGRIVSVGDVQDRMKKKTIEFNDVMSVITRMTDEGGKFFDFQAKMAGTLKVQLANLTLAWNNMLNDIGASHQTLLTVPIAGLKELFLQWQTINRVLTAVVITLGSAKAMQLLFNVAMGKGTAAALKQVMTLKAATKEQYANALATTTMSRAQGLFLIATNRTNLALRQAIVETTGLKWSTAALATTATGLRRAWLLTWTSMTTVLHGVVVGIKGIGAALWSLATNPVFLLMSVITAITDLILQWKQNQEAIRDLNNDISKNAEEAAKSITKFRKTNSDLAASSNVSKSDAVKMWEAISEELETSAISANAFMHELSAIGDVATRVTAAMDIAKRIEETQLALSKLSEDAININHDILWGAMGEGLVEDLEDYKETIRDLREEAKQFNQEFSFSNWGNLEVVQSDMREAEQEIEKFATRAASVIQASLGPDGIRDKIKVTEAVQRIAKEMKVKNPEIRDAAEVLFDLKLDQIMSRQFGDAYDATTSLWGMMMNELKSKHAHVFADMTEEVYDNSYKWNDAQKKAIQETIDFMRNNVPLEFSNVLDVMIKDLNSRDFRIHVGYTFDIPDLDELQKDFRSAFLGGPRTVETQKLYQRYQKKANESTLEWQERLKKEYKQENELLEQKNNIIKTTSGIVKKNAEEEKIQIQQRIDALKAVEKHEGFTYEDKTKTKKTTKRGGVKPEDEVAKALKEELAVIRQMQSNYDKLRKSGYDATTSLTAATNGYGDTLERVNKILGKYGVAQFKASDFVGKDADINTTVKALEQQRKTLLASGKVKLSSIKDLDIEIEKLNVDAKTYNMKKITDGLNNQLSKIKDEYELAVELDANPELSNIFADMFDIEQDFLPKNIEDVIMRYQTKVNEYLAKAFHPDETEIDFDGMKEKFDILGDDLATWANKTGVEVGSELYNTLESKQKELVGMYKKYNLDLIKQTKDLQYELADTNGKIAIEEEKLARLQEKLDNETDERRRTLLQLQIQRQRLNIARLKEVAVKTLDTYKNLFNSLVDHSARVTRQLAMQWKKALENAQKTIQGRVKSYTITDPLSGKKSTVTEKEYNNLLDQVNGKLRETQSSFDKIKEALTAGEDEIVDWVKGVELIADEAEKAASIVNEIGNIAQGLGASESTVEIINDIGESIDGLAKSSKGFSQMMNGDIIGGAVNVVKGLWDSISSWFDNSNKKIDRKIKDSERSVKSLENAYKHLEHAMNESMGNAEISARKAAIANKQLMLSELQNQLLLEESRKKKNRDDDRILDLKGQIIDAENEIADMTKDIANTLFGSDIKSAAEDFVSTWVQAWRAGEDTIDALNAKFSDMIDNMIMKALASKVVAQRLQPIFDIIDTISGQETDSEMLGKLKQISDFTQGGAFSKNINDLLTMIYEYMGIGYGSGVGGAQLSALQQGIQGITEETAGALEAYMNGVSQQVYYQSAVMTEIRDLMLNIGGDERLGMQAEMLLQMQQSYAVQFAIQTILTNWSSANGLAVKVEMI